VRAGPRSARCELLLRRAPEYRGNRPMPCVPLTICPSGSLTLAQLPPRPQDVRLPGEPDRAELEFQPPFEYRGTCCSPAAEALPLAQPVRPALIASSPASLVQVDCLMLRQADLNGDPSAILETPHLVLVCQPVAGPGGHAERHATAHQAPPPRPRGQPLRRLQRLPASHGTHFPSSGVFVPCSRLWRSGRSGACPDWSPSMEKG
jgi:hypothetical protein